MFETVSTFLHDPAVTAGVNLPLFWAILLALVVYRIFAPLIDLLNPVQVVSSIGWWLRDSATERAKRVLRRRKQ